MRRLVLLVDTTVLYSALAYKGPENKVLFSGDHIFATTEYTITEVNRILTAKMGLSPAEARSLIKAIPILVADPELLSDKWDEAQKLMARRDRSDVPLVALALAIEGHHDGIWSTDRDFDVVRGRFKVWKTRELTKD